jgi:RNA polymerase sigma factor (sigma-70 family)
MTALALGISQTLTEREASSSMAHYMREVRRFPLLTPVEERHLAQHIHDHRQRWRIGLVSHLLHVPLLLTYRARVRCGSVPITDIVTPDDPASQSAFVTTLDHLHTLRAQMRQCLRREGDHSAAATPQTVRALRANMRALLQPCQWQATFLLRAWQPFDTAMAPGTASRHQRHLLRFISTLGYRMDELDTLWQSLHDLHAAVECAKQEMVTRNLRLVIKMAREFSHTNMSLEELIQEGNIGLMRAVEKFDYRRNVKFSTYAVWWIKQSIRRAVLQHSSQIRIPEYMRDAVLQVHKAQAALTDERGCPPAAQDIAQYAGLPLERVERGLALVQDPISLDHPRAAEDSRTVYEIVPDTTIGDVQERLEQDAMRTHICDALEQLPLREAEIIRRRFGLYGEPEETLRQIGLDLHLSHERVRQLETRALATLWQQRARLQDFVESKPQPSVCASHAAQSVVVELERDAKARTSNKNDVILGKERLA